jgi:uncharacterized membrane protein YdjX (TVP38/TMEM64 family)
VSEPVEGRGRGGLALRIGLAAAVIAVLVLAGRQLGGELPRFAAWVEGLGAWGPIAFIAGYALAVPAFAPGLVLTLAGGALFGITRGTLYVFIAAVIGSSLSFVIARYVARPWVERRIAANASFASIDRAIAAQGRRIVFLLRLSPVVPFNLLNYALGLSRIRYVDALVASIAMLPASFLYVYYGHVGRELAAAATGGGRERGTADYALLALGLVATIAVTTIVTRIARGALREATEGGGAPVAQE